MALQYFKDIRKGKGKAPVEEEPKSPLLNDEDEKFLEKLTSEEQAPPLPERPVVILDNGYKVEGKDAQTALMDGADKVALPSSPPVEVSQAPKESDSKWDKKRQDYLSYIKSVPSMLHKGKASKSETGAELAAAVDAAKKGEAIKTAPTDGEEAQKENDDLTAVLDQLNLSAVNNRAFSFSEESQRMMAEFTQILKDIVNGVPTAYDDVEKFMKNWDGQLKKMYGDLPPFLQTLVKSLPAKMSGTLAPGLLAAASEKPGADAQSMGVNTASGKGIKARIPSLKKLIASQGTVTAMLRSILNFLKLRFPAVLTGTNVLMSLAVFLLIFVFWYCHKRGKETRLEKEKLTAGDTEDSDFEKSASDLDESTILDKQDEAEHQRSIEAPTEKDETDLNKVLSQPAPALVLLPAEKK